MVVVAVSFLVVSVLEVVSEEFRIVVLTFRLLIDGLLTQEVVPPRVSIVRAPKGDPPGVVNLKEWRLRVHFDVVRVLKEDFDPEEGKCSFKLAMVVGNWSLMVRQKASLRSFMAFVAGILFLDFFCNLPLEVFREVELALERYG